MVNISWNGLPESLKNLEFSNIGEPIPADALENLPHLTDLLLSGKQIGNLHQHTFWKQNNLRTLRLPNCGITSLNPHLFSQLLNLNHLSLSHNEIKKLPADIFGNLVNLGPGVSFFSRSKS